jgi:hypothetical protein
MLCHASTKCSRKARQRSLQDYGVTQFMFNCHEFIETAVLKWKDAGLQKRTKWASTVAGLRGWPRLFQVGHEPDVQPEEDENETEELMEQPDGTQEHGI